MINYQSNWVFNLSLKFAVIICLTVLVLSLIIGTGPLTALIRSSVAFMTFAFLGWATSLVWDVPLVEEELVKDINDQSPEKESTEKEIKFIDKEQSIAVDNSNDKAVEKA
ncbi:MAG: hypothetical protein KDJ52_10695 [Anaerolineae bacterium]|nr:hypothetical protein [Anaerolineae bacterium]